MRIRDCAFIHQIHPNLSITSLHHISHLNQPLHPEQPQVGNTCNCLIFNKVLLGSLQDRLPEVSVNVGVLEGERGVRGAEDFADVAVRVEDEDGVLGPL